jgi:hypothetical protein
MIPAAFNNSLEKEMTPTTQRWIKGLLLLATIWACVACGAKEDYSGNNELAKTQGPSGQAATAAPKGASVHAALMVPQRNRP